MPGNQVVVLSISALSNEFIQNVVERVGQEVSVVSVSQLRAARIFNFLLRLRQLSPRKLILAVEDENGAVMLPILKVIGGITRAESVYWISPKGIVSRISTFEILNSLFGLASATLLCTIAYIDAWYKIFRLRSLERVQLKRSTHLKSVLYLKTNLWFGVKAGGSVGHVAGVINGMVSKGLHVTFLAGEKPVMICDEVDQTIVAAPKAYGLPYELNNLRFQSNFLKAIRRAFKERTFDIVYQRLSVMNFLGALVSQIFRIPLVVEYNGSEVWVARNWGNPLRFERLALATENIMLRAAYKIVTVSDVLADELVSRGVERDRIIVYPNCVDPKVFDPARYSDTQRISFRSRFNLNSSTKIVTFVGTFGKWHGADFLARAVQVLCKTEKTWLKSVDVVFMFVGDGLMLPAVKDILSDADCASRCIFTGLISQRDAPYFLAASDVLVSPHVPNPDGSRFFGSPTKLFEYMAMGKGIVAADLDQIGEVLRPSIQINRSRVSDPTADNHLAVLFKPGDLDGLVRSLKLLLDNEDLRAKLGENARGRALERYTWEHHVQTILNELRSDRSD